MGDLMGRVSCGRQTHLIGEEGMKKPPRTHANDVALDVAAKGEIASDSDEDVD